jgi:hypothetical protein
MNRWKTLTVLIHILTELRYTQIEHAYNDYINMTIFLFLVRMSFRIKIVAVQHAKSMSEL